MKKPKIHFRSIRVRRPSQRSLLIGLAVFVVLAGLVLIIKQARDDSSSLDSNQQISQKVDDLNREDITCQQIDDEIGQESPDKYNSETQKKLLEQRLSCSAELEKPDQALVTAEKLKAIYTAEGNDFKVRILEMTIAEIKTIIKENDKKL